MQRRMLLVVLVAVLTPLCALSAGKLRGRVTDRESKEPLVGANVSIVGTSLGGSTDVNGDFIILNVPPGLYSLKATFIGYAPVTISNIRVNNDLTTESDFALPAEAVSMQAIEIVAQRPLVNKNATNAVRIRNAEDIDNIPVRGINGILALTPGVVLQDHVVYVRGGRFDEVGYYLEGVSVTNPMAGGQAVNLVQDAVEEIQVQAGGYNAEFGGANSGIVQQQLRTGTSSIHATLQYITDNVGLRGKGSSFDGEKTLGAYWYGYNELSATLSGPVLSERIKLFGLFNYIYQHDQSPQPYPGIALGTMVGQSRDTINLNYPAGALTKNPRQDFNYTSTLTMDFTPVTVRLAGTFSNVRQYNLYNTNRNAGAIANILNPDRVEEVDQWSGTGSLKITHFISTNSFYEVTMGYLQQSQQNLDPILRNNFLGYGDSVANAQAGYIWARSPSEVSGGQTGRYLRPSRKVLYDFSFNAPGDVISGYQKFKRENLNITAAFSSQIGKEHSLKVGGEFQRYTIRGYSWNNDGAFSLAGLLANNAALADGDPNKIAPEQVLINAGVNNFGYDVWGAPSSDDGIRGARKPLFAAGYIQDKIEYNDLVINAGVRYDFIDIDNYMMIDPTLPDLSYDFYSGAVKPEGFKKVSPFQALSPRLGVSFPVTDRTVFHTQFGQFVQQSRLRDVFQGPYLTSANIRGGLFISIPVGFDVRPTRTTQYEIGFSQQVGEGASFDITGYYKDIKDQVVYEQVNTSPNSLFGAYYVFTNGDFATTKGLELTFNLRRTKRLQANASLAFQDAQGTGSYPNSNRGIVGAPLDGVTQFKPQYVAPLEYNNAIRGNINLDYRWGKDEGGPILRSLGASALLSFSSGHPFTRGIGAPDLEGDARNRQPVEPLNASVTPWTFQVDLRIDKAVRLFNTVDANFFVYVINLFDARNIENVFLRTGSTTDDGVLSDPNSGATLMKTYGPRYADVYRAINIDYYQRYQNAIGLNTFPYFYGPPRQIRVGMRLEY